MEAYREASHGWARLLIGSTRSTSNSFYTFLYSVKRQVP